VSTIHPLHWRHARKPAAYSLGTCTPLATGHLWLIVPLAALVHDHVPKSFDGARGPVRSLQKSVLCSGATALLAALSFTHISLDRCCPGISSPQRHLLLVCPLQYRMCIVWSRISAYSFANFKLLFRFRLSSTAFSQVATFMKQQLKESRGRTPGSHEVSSQVSRGSPDDKAEINYSNDTFLMYTPRCDFRPFGRREFNFKREPRLLGHLRST